MQIHIPRRLIVMAATVLVILLSCTSCWWDSDDRGFGDAAVGDFDDSPATVINFPNTFANVAIKCYSGTAILTTTRQAAPLVIPDSSFCKGNEVVVLDGES